MKQMVRTLGPLLGMVVLMLCIAHFAWAGSTTSTGEVSEQLSKILYCQITGMFEGTVGLLIGLVMLVGGFWVLIQGGSVPAALSMIIMGGLVTALPSLINSTLAGIGSLLQEAHISQTNYQAPSCSGSMQLPDLDYNRFSPPGSSSSCSAASCNNIDVNGTTYIGI